MTSSAKVTGIRQMGHEMTTGIRCARCSKPAPSVESNEYNDWESLGPDTQVIVCPNCITHDEQLAIDEASMAVEQKIRENRLRRMAERQALRLVKSRRRDPRAIGYGGFMIVNRENVVVAGEIDSAQAMDLDAVERYLTSGSDGT